jgi:hypothetical protein
MPSAAFAGQDIDTAVFHPDQPSCGSSAAKDQLARIQDPALSSRILTTSHTRHRPGPHLLPANDIDAPSMSQWQHQCSINAVTAPSRAARDTAG